MAFMTETDNVRQFIHELESAKEEVDAASMRRTLQTIMFDVVERIWAGEPEWQRGT